MANVKAIIIDGERYSVQSTSFEYTVSNREGTPIVGDAGELMDVQYEYKAGMMKGKFSFTKDSGATALKTLEGGEIIVELSNSVNVIGSNCYQIANNSTVVSDSVVELEFTGDITEN